MTATQQGAEPDRQHGPAAGPRIAKRRVASAVYEVCPYLRSESGAWRSAYAARDHRCGAVTPAARLTIAKQRSLCLVPAHESCATFAAARAAQGSSASTTAAEGDAALWPAIRSTPVVLEPIRGLMTPLAGVPARTGGQALLVGLMALAFLILVVARTTAPTAPGSPTPGSSAGLVDGGTSPTPGDSSPVASSTPGPSPSPLPSSTPGSSPTASPMPSATPAASVPAGQTYTVQPGDTMSGIAAKFGTTVKAIAAANDIADPRVIHVGQVLIIP